MFILSGQLLPLDVPFTGPDGTRYPANWLRLSTAEEKAAIGITEQPDTPQQYWDQRYYWGYTQEGELIPKQLEDELITSEEGNTYTQTGLKTLHIRQTKETANSLLAPTDWYVVRKLERNIDIPVGIVSYRASVIEVSEERENLIKSVTTVAELKGLYESSVVGIGTEQITNAPVMPEWPSINN